MLSVSHNGDHEKFELSESDGRNDFGFHSFASYLHTSLFILYIS